MSAVGVSVFAMTQHVRPTQRALADLGLVFPPLNIELHTLAHSLIQKAQRIPGEVASGGAERVRALKDRVWFKVKTGNLRGVVAEVQIPDGFGPRADADYSHSAWWLAAGGLRQDDTPTRDFYAVLSDECRRLAKGTGAGVYTAHLLPTAADYRRWQLENATVIAIALRRKVREAIALGTDGRTLDRDHRHFPSWCPDSPERWRVVSGSHSRGILGPSPASRDP